MAFFDADFMKKENENLKAKIKELEEKVSELTQLVEIKEQRINKMMQEQTVNVKNRFIPKQKTEPAKTETETEETKPEE